MHRTAEVSCREGGRAGRLPQQDRKIRISGKVIVVMECDSSDLWHLSGGLPGQEMLYFLLICCKRLEQIPSTFLNLPKRLPGQDSKAAVSAQMLLLAIGLDSFDLLKSSEGHHGKATISAQILEAPHCFLCAIFSLRHIESHIESIQCCLTATLRGEAMIYCYSFRYMCHTAFSTSLTISIFQDWRKMIDWHLPGTWAKNLFSLWCPVRMCRSDNCHVLWGRWS